MVDFISSLSTHNPSSHLFQIPTKFLGKNDETFIKALSKKNKVKVFVQLLQDRS